jgi:hypothetical protein
MPSSGHRKVLKAASTRSGRAIYMMSTARRGKTPAKIANRQPISPFVPLQVIRTSAQKVLAPLEGVDPPTEILGCDFGPSGCQEHHPEGVNRGRLRAGIRETLALGQALPADRYKALPLASHGSCIRRWVVLSSWSITFNVRSIASGRRPPMLS